MHCDEFSPFLSSDHSDGKEKTLLLSTHSVLQSEPFGPVESLFFHLHRKHEANFARFTWCLQDGQVLVQSHSPAQMEPKFQSQLGLTI